MQPLQVLLGDWRGTTQRQFGEFKAVDEPQWVWDFQTDPARPALVMTSEESPYFREMRLTYRSEDNRFQLELIDPNSVRRTLAGRFSEEPQVIQGDDEKQHVTYKLELTETDAAEDGDPYQIVLNQQNNHRYLVELSKRRGSRFVRFDTVGTQRLGTSFALDDSDYREKTCIISGGLGTMQVSHKGRAYWVCCTGCQAAFEDDPEMWLAEAKKNAEDE